MATDEVKGSVGSRSDESVPPESVPPEGPGFDAHGPVVVGVDGSDTSRAAAKWAARQAELTGVGLEVFAAYELPVTFGWAVALPEGLDLETEAQAMASAVLEELRQSSSSQVEMVVKVVNGHAATLLVEESASASLVVVGSRGLGAFSGMLIGSVSAYLVSHSHCPVAVIAAHHHHHRRHEA